jgi:hypothetical protein
LVWTSAFAQAPEEAFRKDTMKLLELTGSSKLGIQMANMLSGQFLDGIRKMNPEIHARAIEVAKELLNAEFTKAFESPDGLMPELVTIYAKHFTHQEVLGLIAFYETELGRKAVSTLPQLMQESGAVGQQWAAQHVSRILAGVQERLRAEGLIK